MAAQPAAAKGSRLPACCDTAVTVLTLALAATPQHMRYAANSRTSLSAARTRTWTRTRTASCSAPALSNGAEREAIPVLVHVLVHTADRLILETAKCVWFTFLTHGMPLYGLARHGHGPSCAHHGAQNSHKQPRRPRACCACWRSSRKARTPAASSARRLPRLARVLRPPRPPAGAPGRAGVRAATRPRQATPGLQAHVQAPQGPSFAPNPCTAAHAHPSGHEGPGQGRTCAGGPRRSRADAPHHPLRCWGHGHASPGDRK